jgi:hypothetical protein
MVRQIILQLLGPLGRQALAFYIDHSAVINGLVVIYALVLLLARRNLQRIQAGALQDLRSRLSTDDLARLDEFPPGFSWPDIIRKSSFFPLVAGPSTWLPRPCRPADLHRISPLPRLLERIEGAAPPAAGAGGQAS